MSVKWDEVLAPMPTPRRFVTRRRIVAGALAATVAIVAGTVTWLLSSDPLELGSLTGAPAGTLARTAVDTGFGDTVYYVSAAAPGTFEIGYELANTGTLPLTVQGIASPSRLTFAGMARYPTFAEPDDSAAGQIVPFQPVTIEPGDGRFLVVQLRITDEAVCNSSGSYRVPSDPTIEYRTLGLVPRSVTLDLPFTIVEVCGSRLPPSYSWSDGAR